MSAYPTPEEIAAYIAEKSPQYGVDPNIAVRVARSEGLNADPEEGWQSDVSRGGKRERSYGPFQLYIDGGLGNEFMAKTGLDPRDPGTWQQQVDFSLAHAGKNGWGAWYGAANSGIGDFDGIGGTTNALMGATGTPPFIPDPDWQNTLGRTQREGQDAEDKKRPKPVANMLDHRDFMRATQPVNRLSFT